MSKKCFSLIHSEHLRVAPKTKILSAASYSKLLNAEEVLEAVKKDAEQYRKEVVQECEKLKEQAEDAGFYAGFQKWAQAVASLEKTLEDEKEKIRKSVVPVALKAAQKIFGRELEQSHEAIIDIVRSSLKAVAQHKEIIIYVSKEDRQILEKSKDELKMVFESIESLSIREREDIQPGGCVIETEGGIINARIENRWHVLEQAFEKLLSQPSNDMTGKTHAKSS